MSRTARLNRSDFQVGAQHLRAVQERRASGAAGAHDSRPRRQRTRLAAKRAAIREAA